MPTSNPFPAVPPCRDRPVPIPAPGSQLTSLSHVDDLADMMARVPGNRRAVGEHFNLCSDRCITFDGGHGVPRGGYGVPCIKYRLQLTDRTRSVPPMFAWIVLPVLCIALPPILAGPGRQVHP